MNVLMKMFRRDFNQKKNMKRSLKEWKKLEEQVQIVSGYDNYCSIYSCSVYFKCILIILNSKL